MYAQGGAKKTRSMSLASSIECQMRRTWPAMAIERSRRTTPVIVLSILAAIALSLFTPPTHSEESNLSADHEARSFGLKKGKGVPVCDVYLDLLNSTPFERTPFCGRPDEGPVSGFAHLERHKLTVDEINSVFPRVYEFVKFNDQNHPERFWNPTTNSWDPSAMDIAGISDFVSRRWMTVWTYAAALDIENAGTPVPVLIWQGYGVWDGGGVCGASYDRKPWDFPYSDQLAFILAADGLHIDEDRTRAVFGQQGKTSRLSKGFRPTAASVGVFKFDGLYYIDAEDKPPGKDADLAPVKVLLREGGRTNEVCSLVPQDVPYPEPRLVNPGPLPHVNIRTIKQ